MHVLWEFELVPNLLVPVAAPTLGSRTPDQGLVPAELYPELSEIRDAGKLDWVGMRIHQEEPLPKREVPCYEALHHRAAERSAKLSGAFQDGLDQVVLVWVLGDVTPVSHPAITRVLG